MEIRSHIGDSGTMKKRSTVNDEKVSTLTSEKIPGLQKNIMFRPASQNVAQCFFMLLIENCEFSMRSWDGGWWRWWRKLMKLLYSQKVDDVDGWKFDKNMKKCENWVQKKSRGWEITFPGSVFYTGNDGAIHFAQKRVKLSKMKVFDQKKSLKIGWAFKIDVPIYHRDQGLGTRGRGLMT